MADLIRAGKGLQVDVLVVGGGHAGLEASLATARLGLSTVLVTGDPEKLGYMSCNPSIGGLAKGHIVREIDVLGGEMGKAADASCIQFKRLNSSKGPAVRGTRMQADKEKYSKYMQKVVENTSNLRVVAGEVVQLLAHPLEKGEGLSNFLCQGAVLRDGTLFYSKATILTTGTFMNGVLHLGLRQIPGGRMEENPTCGLSNQMRKELGFSVRRFKTGTPARLHRDSIDWSRTVEQKGDAHFFPFSFSSSLSSLLDSSKEGKNLPSPRLPQVSCYLSRTTEETHDIIRKNLDQSPLFCGQIQGVGPRYCPSIEDKVTRFSDRTSHQTFLEPEGLDTPWIYLQGISTSLPEEVQDQFLRTIPGLENVKVLRYGYAVEYDYFEPYQIYPSMEARSIEGLFCAGQVNGTSGYEEAAAQGLIAGINAAHKILGRPEVVLRRDEAYIGVLIDDLVTKNTDEPYRMFTSRAEHRLVLREDNTLDRLFGISSNIGLVPNSDLEKMEELKARRKKFFSFLRETKIYPSQEASLTRVHTLDEFLRRPEKSCRDLLQLGFSLDPNPMVTEPVEIEIKYAGYIKKQEEWIEQMKRLENLLIPRGMDYRLIKGLSNEEIEKLSLVQPRTLGQAQRLSGVNPSAIQAILIHLRKRS